MQFPEIQRDIPDFYPLGKEIQCSPLNFRAWAGSGPFVDPTLTPTEPCAYLSDS